MKPDWLRRLLCIIGIHRWHHYQVVTGRSANRGGVVHFRKECLVCRLHIESMSRRGWECNPEPMLTHPRKMKDRRSRYAIALTKPSLVLICVALLTSLAAAFDENPMRDALDRWHEFYHREMHKADVEKPVGMYLSEGLVEGVNTRRMQLRFFDRKICRLFGGIKDEAGASNFVWQVNEWTTKPLPDHP